MGPFVPEIISDQLNLVVALLLGIGFGFVLEQAGFSSSRRLAGVFYGYDFTVLRVFFTATVTAMSGILLLGYAGMLDTGAIFVNPTWLMPAIVGGGIMGVGFIVGGYCPGTGVCAAAIGKVDAMFFVGGGLLGVLIFGEAFPLTKPFYESTLLGPIRVFDSLGISQGLFAFLLIAAAVAAFTVTTIIEKRVNPKEAPSLAFEKWRHVASAAGVLLLGVVLIFLPDRKERLMSKVNAPVFLAGHTVPVTSPDELAFRLADREPNIRVVDIRPAHAYDSLALPGSINVPVGEFFGKEWRPAFGQKHVRKVLVADDETQERAACLLLLELGYENVSALEGGYGNFSRTILSGAEFIPTGSRWDGDVRTFRRQARTDILKMINDAHSQGPAQGKKEKKIQGGC